jgi:hypothetical protein
LQGRPEANGASGEVNDGAEGGEHMAQFQGIAQSSLRLTGCVQIPEGDFDAMYLEAIEEDHLKYGCAGRFVDFHLHAASPLLCASQNDVRMGRGHRGKAYNNIMILGGTLVDERCSGGGSRGGKGAIVSYPDVMIILVEVMDMHI